MNKGKEKNLNFFRKLAIIFSVICIVQLIVAIVLPDILSKLLKTWLLVITTCGSLGLGVALFLSRSDKTITFFLILLSFFLNGLISGVSIAAAVIDKK